MEWPEPGAVVLRDVFPAEVAAGPTVFRSARTVITRERVYVFVTQDGKPVLALGMAYDPAQSVIPPLSAPANKASHLTLADGSQIHVNRQRGCGCGSPLKSWQPWAPYRKAAA